MKIEKIIKSKIEQDYIFVKGNLDLDTDYFIKKIEKGMKDKTNRNFHTNLKSGMTSFGYFMNDKEFFKIIIKIYDFLDYELLGQDGTPYGLSAAWGFRQDFSHYSSLHHHLPSLYSGAIMLNDHSQYLSFPQINEKLEAAPGNFAIFSSFIKHGNRRNETDEPRYGLSFNMHPSGY